MRIAQKTLLLLSLISANMLYAEDDCIHKNYPGFLSLFTNRVHMYRDDAEERSVPPATHINNPLFQSKYGSKFPHPPYDCSIIDNESASLSPVPRLDQMSTQGNFGACYATASLFALEEAINRARPDKDRVKYSLSNAICVGNRKQKLYQDGGLGAAVLLNIAKKAQLVSCLDQKISHDDVVAKICASATNDNSSNIAQLSQLWQEVKSTQKECRRMQVPAFTINEVVAKNGKTIPETIFALLQSNTSLITLPLPDHETNLYGINTYNCKNLQGESIKIKSYKLIDPNGIKLELLSDDLEKGINEGTSPYYVTIEDEKSGHGDVFKGPSSLSTASHAGDVSIVTSYLPKAGINQARNDGAAPLFIAAKEGHPKVVTLLLNNGANVDQVENNGATPLYVAAQNGHTEVVKLLLESGATVDRPLNNGMTPLYAAAQNKHIEVITLLVKSGANIGKTIDFAKRHGLTKTAEFLSQLSY
ncbi:MAG: ankyrin repeat domain-containing protein [Oligoflexia bacterium]|nr:ankyrin repeat domain-containing protein [Oligoflexia bacterium]MBF0367006.1 ankyrin repeat domain-containing protein [Oligoflexia bacterium]